MPRVAVNEQILTFDQYLEIEASAETRHEFVNGLMFAMAGGTKVHNLIASNIHLRLRAASKGSTNGTAQQAAQAAAMPAIDRYFFIFIAS